MSRPIVILFPGQGSQYVGMGTELGDNNCIDSINNTLGYDLKSIMLNGPIEDLTQTSNTQPAIVAYSIALWQKLKLILDEKKISPYAILGHSVGEYSALVACNSLSFNDAIKAVHFRGKYMQEAVPSGLGTMYAILKVPEEIVKKACLESSNKDSVVSPANFNEPNQIVISGHKEACEKAVTYLNDNYENPFRAIELKVSAPFHCSLMNEATLKMKKLLDETNIKTNTLNYIANIDAKTYPANTEVLTIKNNLINQIEGSVLWTQSIQNLPKDSLLIEVGPGKVLSGLVRKINRDLEVINLNKSENFDLIMEKL